MAIRDYFKFPQLPWRTTPLSNAAILRGSDIVRGRQVISAASDPHPRVRPIAEGNEFGASGTENFGGYIRREDFNPELDNFVTAVRIYDKMRLSDAQIRAMLSVIKLPLRGATWTCIPPEDGDDVDSQIADFCNHAIFNDDAMEDPWDDTLRHILLMLDFGFSCLELVWRVESDGSYRLKRLAPRLSKTIRMWNVDRNGKLLAVIQYAPVPVSTAYPRTGSIVPGSSHRDVPLGGLSPGVATANNPQVANVHYSTSVSFQYLTLPSEYMAVFTLEREGDNYQGHSLLRAVYRNFYFKDQAYHLEGVRLDRWGVGIPVAQLEEGHNLNQQDLDALVEVLEAVRANERAYLIAPPHVTYDLLPRTGSQTAGSGATQWIDHHDQQIARNVLAGFLTMGQDTHGTLGFGSRLTDMFVSSLNGVAAGICSTLKHQVVTKLCDLNYDMTNRKYPRVTCRDLEQADLDKLVTTLGALVGTFITPDDDTESLLRKLLKLPSLDKNETRKAKADAGVPATPAGGAPEYPMAGTKAADQSAKAGEKAAAEGKPPGGGPALPGAGSAGEGGGEGGPGLPPPGEPPSGPPAPATNPFSKVGTKE